jgi:hypothetical protein
LFSLLLVVSLLPAGVIGNGYAIEAEDTQDFEPFTLPEVTGEGDLQPLAVAPLVDVNEAVVLHGGELITTSSTGVGSDPMHTRVVYQLASDAAGPITIMPDSHNNAITIIGNGFGNAPNNVTLNIAKGINLTIKDLSLRTTDDSYLINFNGVVGNSSLLANQLILEGTNVLENDVPNGLQSVIHIAPTADLAITGNGYLYLDKNTSGAGIGGDGVSSSTVTPEASGSLSIEGGNLYLSGTGTGAVIGTGGGHSTATPGDIAVRGGNLNVVTSSSAAGIGGGASSPAGKLLVTGGTTTVITDARGPAIGKGSSAEANASPGTITITGGSLKTVATPAAAIYWNISAGTTPAVITAVATDSDELPAVLGRFVFDTSLLEVSEQPALYFIALADNAPFFRGGLHTYLYSATSEGSILDRWVPSQPTDTQLYFSLPRETTRLSVNGEGFTLAWNEETQTFSCTPGSPDDGSLWNGMVDTSWYNTTDTEFWLQKGAQLAGLAQIVNGLAEGIEQDDFTGKTVNLFNDVNLNGIEWTPIGGGTTTIQFDYTNPITGLTDHSLTNVNDDESFPFEGAFNGNGNAITGFYINSSEDLRGFFGYLGSQGEVSRLTVDGALRTTSSLDAIGSIVGFNRGMIDHCIGQVEVIAPSAYNVGGIAGFNDGRTGNGTIQFSGNRGNVHGYGKVGGITGQNAGLIRNSYNLGNVNGTNALSKNGVGGIAGRNGNNNTAVEVGRIVNCFSICEVGRDGGQKWVGGITGFQNTLSSIENSYFAGSFPSYNNSTNNPIVGYTDIPSLATEMNVGNYTLDTLKHSGTAQGEIGIPVTLEYMKSVEFINDINGQDGVGRAYLLDFEGADALNDGFPILRGVHVEDTASPTGVRIVADPTVNKVEGKSHYAYTEGQPFDTKGFLAVVDYSDGTSEKAYNVELSIPGTLLTTDASITLTARFGELSASMTYDLVVIRDDLIDMWIGAPPEVTIYGSGDRFETRALEIVVDFKSGARRVLGSEEYTFEPQVLRAGDTAVTIRYSFNGVEKTINIPVTVLDTSRPSQDESGAYQIVTQNDLVWFMAKVGQEGAVESNAVLMDDLDMRDTLFVPIGGASFYLYQYEGSFDGNGKSITLDVNATGQSGTYVGLFRAIAAEGEVKDLTIKGSVRGLSYVGGIAGICLGKVEGCRNEATIIGTATAQVHVGGIVGSLDGTIQDCVNVGSVSAQNFIGGIVGAVYGEGVIEGVTNSGAITASTSLVGGIAGLVGSTAVIRNGENHGVVTGAYHIGGIVGELRGTGTLSDLKNRGTVNATSASTSTAYSTGGVIGYLSSTGTLTRSVNIGSVNGELANTGGVVGYISTGGTVNSCYNGGAVTGLAPRNNTAVGGIVGAINNAAATLSDCYNTGVTLHAPEGSGTYIAYRAPVLGQYKPSGAIDTTQIGGNYYSADSAASLTGISVGTVVSAANRETVRTLLAGITSERIIMLDAGYPILASLYSGAIATGDASGDGVFGANDLILFARVLLGFDSFSSAQLIAVDMDGDDFLSSADLILMARKMMYG